MTDRVSDRERYLIFGDYYSLSEETINQAITAYSKLLELYPEDWTANINLAIIFRDLEDWDNAIERFKASIQNYNREEAFFSCQNLAITYMYKNLYKEADEVLKYYIRNFSDNVIISGILAYNYIFSGEYKLALKEINKAIALDPTYYRNLYIKGDIHLINGDLIEAEEEYKKLLISEEKTAHSVGKRKLGALNLIKGKFEESKNQFGPDAHFELAYINFRLGNLDAALDECNKTDEKKLDLLLKGLIRLERKEVEEATEIADMLKGLVEKGINKKEKRYYRHLKGLIELRRNNYTDAIALFKEALSSLPIQYTYSALFIDHLARAYFESGDLDNAKEEYEKITSLTFGRVNYGDIYAKSFYRLGKIYEQQGNRAKAIEHYEKFLSLWKDADPGIAEVEDAKKRLAGLKES